LSANTGSSSNPLSANTGSSSNSLSANTPQFGGNHFHRHLHNHPYAQDSVANFPRHHQHPHSPYSTRIPRGDRSPYTPYSTPNPYGAYVNPYAPNSINAPYDPRIPYSPGNIANPYGIYGKPYSPDSASGSYSINAQQFYNSQRNYLGNLGNNSYNPYLVPPSYGQYSNPFFSEWINNR
jgi:hypothetical protein